MRAAFLVAVLVVLAGCGNRYAAANVPRETVAACVRGAAVTGKYEMRIHRKRRAQTYRVLVGENVSELQSKQINACIAQAESPALRRRVGLFGQYTICNSVFDRGSGYCINASTKSPAL